VDPSLILIPIVVALITVALNAIVSTKVRFACDQKTAFTELRRLALTGLSSGGRSGVRLASALRSVVR